MGIAEKILPLACAAGIAIQAQGIVDVHSHILPHEFIASLEQHNALIEYLQASEPPRNLQA